MFPKWDFHQIMQATFHLQYLALSVPSYAVVGKNLITRKKLSWLEFTLALVGSVTHVMVALTYRLGKNNRPLFNGLGIVNYAGNSLLTFIGCIEGKRNIGHLKKIFKEISALESRIMIKRKKTYTLQWNLFPWYFMAIAFTITCIVQAFKSPYPLHIRILYFISIVRVYAQPITASVQYLFLIMRVTQYLKWIREQIALLESEVMSKNTFKRPLGVIKLYMRESNIKDMAEKVENIESIHERVHNLKNQINETYSLRLWTDITGITVQQMYTIYTIISSANKTLGLGRKIYRMASAIFRLWYSIHVCQNVAQEGRAIGEDVHRLFSRWKNKQQSDEIIAFSLSLTHRDPTITAYRFYRIDYTLFGTIFSNIVMHIIAVMQLDPEGPGSGTGLIE